MYNASLYFNIILFKWILQIYLAVYHIFLVATLSIEIYIAKDFVCEP